MDAWHYVGFCDVSNGWNYLWTNGTDLAWCNCNSFDGHELQDYPHAYAEYNYGGLVDLYNGDIMRWFNDIGAVRDTLYDMKSRKGWL